MSPTKSALRGALEERAQGVTKMQSGKAWGVHLSEGLALALGERALGGAWKGRTSSLPFQKRLMEY